MGDLPVNVAEFLTLVRQHGLEYFGLYYGKYRGTVVNNEDPQKLGRVQVRIPQIAGDNKFEYWAFPHGNAVGDDFGDFNIPPKGSPVWVSFEQGDPQYPLYTGGHWAKPAAAPAFGGGDPKKRTKASENWIMEMNDKDNKFTIKSKTGTNVFEIDGQAGTLSVTIGGSTLVMNGSDVVLMGHEFLQHTHVDVEPGAGTSGIVGEDGGGGGGGGGGSGSGTGGSGSLRNRTEVNDTNYTVDPNDDYLIAMVALTATRTITLPAAVDAIENKIYLIKDESGSVDGSKKITVSAADLIDGVASVDVTVPYGGLEVYWSGNSYFSK